MTNDKYLTTVKRSDSHVEPPPRIPPSCGWVIVQIYDHHPSFEKSILTEKEKKERKGKDGKCHAWGMWKKEIKYEM